MIDRAGPIDLTDWLSTRSFRDWLLQQRRAAREALDLSKYEGPKVPWSRRAFVEGMLFFYDPQFYDRSRQRYQIDQFLDEAERDFGGYDILILWQPYPRIGIDGRNQFQMWRDMPGGLTSLRGVVDRLHERGVRALVNYVPWDTLTNPEPDSDAAALAALVHEIGGDGIYGDTMHGFDREFADALAYYGPDLILESEANPTMEQSQWQSDAWGQIKPPEPLFPPVQQWIEPRTMVRFVDRQSNDRRYMLAKALFFGLGFVVWENVFGWWNPLRPEDRAMLRRVVPLLRDNVEAFVDPNWTPLDYALGRGVYGNLWESQERTVVTLINTNEQPVRDIPIRIPARTGFSYHDVWNRRVISPSRGAGATGELYVTVSLEPRSPGCLVACRRDVTPSYSPYVETLEPDRLQPPEFGPDLYRRMGRLVADRWEWNAPGIVVPESYRQPVTPAAESPRPVPPTPVFQHPAPDSTEGASQVAFKPSSQGVSEEVSQDVMVQIPGARFEMIVAHTWRFDEGPCYSDPGEYGHEHPAQHVWLDPYWIDRTEVTNRAYHAFMQATAYSPADRDNFLAHWEWPSDDPRSAYPAEELAEHPVVYVDLNDARAYAAWAGKRLPTEAEWQFAAQGRDRRHWPWGWEFDPTRCNHRSGTTTPVTMYPSGASPHGVLDMAGNVWELTESERDDGHIHYVLLRSGSHLVLDEPRNEVLWYVATGAQPCWAHQKQLLLAPSLDRCATVGFRCVAPALSSSQ